MKHVTAAEISRTKIETDLQHLAEQEQERKLSQFDMLKDLTCLRR